MKYIYTNVPVDKAADLTASKITEHLCKGERVLLLLSGGSGSAVAIEAAKKLGGIDLSNLFVTMTDERYGLVGHKDENWQQLLDAGLKLPGATLYRPLIGADIQTTTAAFNDWLTEQFKSADYKFGIFGIGADGHTVGIKPNSIAASSSDLAASFTGEDFERITITFPAIEQINEAVIQASGTDKKTAIRDLIYRDLPLSEQPAQILKTIPLATLYTNNKREEL